MDGATLGCVVDARVCPSVRPQLLLLSRPTTPLFFFYIGLLLLSEAPRERGEDYVQRTASSLRVGLQRRRRRRSLFKGGGPRATLVAAAAASLSLSWPWKASLSQFASMEY